MENLRGHVDQAMCMEIGEEETQMHHSDRVGQPHTNMAPDIQVFGVLQQVEEV
jgi:hypothetical protein